MPIKNQDKRSNASVKISCRIYHLISIPVPGKKDLGKATIGI
jgi:hypothetical protein